jgi:hypothetical protein
LAAAWGGPAGLGFVFFLLGYMRGTANLSFMNADSLYGYLLIKDLVEGGGPYQWFLQPANGIFQDLILLFAAFLIDGSLRPAAPPPSSSLRRRAMAAR